MKNEAMVFGIVTILALVVATIGHAVNPAICVAIKPMSWPFLALAWLAGKRLYKAHRKEK